MFLQEMEPSASWFSLGWGDRGGTRFFCPPKRNGCPPGKAASSLSSIKLDNLLVAGWTTSAKHQLCAAHHAKTGMSRVKI
jgi:hypothetical protein